MVMISAETLNSIDASHEARLAAVKAAKDARIAELEARIKEIEARIATAGALASQNAPPDMIVDALSGRLKRQS